MDGSIRTQPERVLFWDMVDCDLAMDLPEGTTGRNPKDYLLKLREAQFILVQTTQDYLRKHRRKISVDGGPKNLEVTKFAAGDYVLLTYPNRRPTSWRTCIEVPWSLPLNLIKVRDLITNKQWTMVHANRIRPFNHPKNMPKEKIEILAATDLDEFYVEKNIGHSSTGKNAKKWKFRVRWLG